MFAPTILRQTLSVFAAVVVSISFGGCSSSPTVTHPAAASPVETPTKAAVRYGMYRLVEVGADDAQLDLMEQLIDINVPNAATATVADAITHALLRTGYSLCEPSGGAASIFARMPLPAPHFHLGPIRLREALSVLVGPSWILDVNDGERIVCFSRVSAKQGTATPILGWSTDPASLAAKLAAHASATYRLASIWPLMDTDIGPPFTPLHIEREGTEMLSVVPLCGGSASVAHTLRVGDVEGGWLLARLRQNEAEFDVSGVPQRITLR